MNARLPAALPEQPDHLSAPLGVRVFFALVPEPTVRSGLISLARDVAQRSRGRAVSGNHIHLTMAFVGDVALSALPSLSSVGDRIRLAGAVITFDTLGAWRASGIAWVAPSTVPPPILALHAALATTLTDAGFELDARPFRPHITLARRCVSPLPRARCAPVRWTVDRLRLIASELRPEGPAYREISSWPLAIAD